MPGKKGGLNRYSVHCGSVAMTSSSLMTVTVTTRGPQRGEIAYEIQNLYGFSGDSGIQRRFRDSVKIQLDSVRFGGIHQDSVKIQLGNFQLPRSHSCICARDKQFPFDHVISIRENPVISVVD